MGDLSGDYDGGEEDERLQEWEQGLPNLDELPSLSQGLIPPDLLSAFNIRPEPYRTSGDVSRASRDTLSTIQGSNFKPFGEIQEEIDEEEEEEDEESEEEASEAKKARRSSPAEDAAAKALKRPRLVWTPQLHKRFVDVVAHLGIKNAVPKTIMQMMNVEGLTRENVASHLQKYRLYLKRMQGVSFDPPANSSTANTTEHPPAPAPAPEMQIPMPGYGHPMIHMPMPVMGTDMGTGMGNHQYHHHPHNNNPINHHYYHNYYHHYQYNSGIMQAGNNKFGPVMNYHPHVAPGDK